MTTSRSALCHVALVLCVMSMLLPAQSAAALQGTRDQQIALIDSIAESPVIENRVAGLAAAVVRGTDTLFFHAYGFADLEWNVPMVTDAVFEIGSVTKQFTAAAVLRLRDEGKLDLDADITTYLPDFPTQGHRIPVRRLLDHTSGIRGMTEIEAFRVMRPQDLPRDTLVTLIASRPFDFAPGEALIYNNSAYFLLGLIIEAVSETTYERYIEDAFFRPLGMTRSSYCSNTAVVPRRAHGYNLTRTGLERGAYLNHTWPYAAGSLCSTIGDLVTWLRALHGGRVLPDSSYREMITPGHLTDGTPVRYAMGLAVTPDARGRPAIHHGGAIESGFVADTRYYPNEDLVVVTLVNTTGNLSPAALATEFVDVLVPPSAMTRRPFEGDVSPLLGIYTGPARGRHLTVTVMRAPGGVAVSVGNRRAVPLSWVDGWTFRLGPVQLVTFERDGAQGPAVLLRLDGGGNHYVLRRQRE